MLRRSLLGALALSLVATNAARAGWRAERTRWWPRIDAVGAAAVDDSTFVLRTHGWIGRAHWDSNSVELGKLRPVAMHGEAVWASGGMAYATSSPGVLDVFDLETLSLVNQVDLGDGIEDGNVYTYGFAQNGDRLYVALFGGGISLLDASEPMAPILVANTPSRGAPWFGPTRLELMDNMLISAEAGLGWGIYSLDAAGVPTMEHYEWLGGYDRDIEPLPGRRVGVAGDEILGIYSIDQNYQPHLIGSEWRHQARFTGLERYGPLAALSSWHHRYPNDICPQGFGFYAYTFWNLQTDPWGTEHRLTIPTNDCGASTGTFHRLSDNGLVLLDRGGGFRALEIDEGGEQIREIGSIAKQGRVYDAVINDSLLVSAESRYGGYRWVIDREGEVIEGAYELPRGDARNFWTADLDHESGRIFLGYSSFSAGDTIAIMEVWGDTLIRVGEIEESAANGMWFHEGILYGRLSRVWAYDLREFPEVRYLNTYDDSWGLDLAVTPGDSIDAMYMVGDDLFDGDVSVVSLNRDSGEMQLHEKIEVDYAAWGTHPERFGTSANGLGSRNSTACTRSGCSSFAFVKI